MVKFSKFYKQVLNTMRSNTLANMEDKDIVEMLDLMLIRAIAEFRFPRVSLEYKTATAEDGSTELVFENEVTQRELNVLLVLVKLYWIEQQLDDENRFIDLYYDKDVKTYSKANLIKNLNARYKEAKESAKVAQYNYSRGYGSNVAVGTINE